MTPKRFFFVMAGVTLLLGSLLLFGAYTGRNMFKKEGQKLSDLKLEQSVLDKNSEALLRAKNDIGKYTELEQIAKSVVPQDKDQAKTVLEIVNLARQSGIEVTGITFPRSLLGQAAQGKVKKGAQTDNNLTQLTPLDSPKGVYSMEIKVDTNNRRSVSYDQLIDFLTKLENNRRTAQVTNISITPESDNRGQIKFSLTLTSYVKP